MIDRVAAIHFLNEVQRMCNNQTSCSRDCPIKQFVVGDYRCPMMYKSQYADELVYAVEKWVNENPDLRYKDYEDD